MSTERRARVLIAEDERLVARDLEEIVKHLGYETTGTVSSAASAVVAVEKERPDLVLMDIRLRGKGDGVEAAAIIRDRYQVGVVYVTAHTDPATTERAAATKPLGFIVKPFDERAVQRAVENALYVQRLEGSLDQLRQKWPFRLISGGKTGGQPGPG